MTLDQFSDGLLRWGAALDQWPERERLAAFSLLDLPTGAQGLLAEAVWLEAFIRTHDPGHAIGQDSVVRMINTVMARLPAAAPRRLSWRAWLERLTIGDGGREWVARFALSTSMAVILGLVVGSRLPYEKDSQQTSPLETLAMSITNVPMDLR